MFYVSSYPANSRLFQPFDHVLLSFFKHFSYSFVLTADVKSHLVWLANWLERESYIYFRLISKPAMIL